MKKQNPSTDGDCCRPLSPLSPLSPAHIPLFFATLQAANPNPRTELHYRTNFELLVAVLLSAQSTDAAVNRVTHSLFAIANTPHSLLLLGQEGLEAHLRTLGLYRNKTRYVLQLCERLIAQHAGEVPHTRTELEALPGVGRKTANVVLNVAFAQPTIAVDTHIFRVSRRTGLAWGQTVREVENLLLERIPPDYLLHAHHWLILLGRYVCQAKKPRCGQCPVARLCVYENKLK